MAVTLFPFPGVVGGLPFEEDALGIGRRIEDEGRLIEGGREVPGQVDGVLRPGLVGEGGDDEPAGERIVAELNPDLPVDAFLVEDVLLAGDAFDGGGAGVDGGLDLIDVVFVGSPFEEVDEGQFDVEFFLDLLE